MLNKPIRTFAIIQLLLMLGLASIALDNNVFFSGDGGLKYLWAKHFAEISLITLPKPEVLWARELWQQGLSPFKPPFAYQINNEFWMAFPLLFPLLISWLFPYLGSLSTMILPFSSWVIIVLCFYSMFYRQSLRSGSKDLAFLFLLLSPLSWYGVIFSEHAVACSCLTLAIWFRISDEYSYRNMLLSGLFCGLAAVFRPEALVVSLFWALGMFMTFDSRRGQKISFVAALSSIILLFALINIHFYSSPFGLHAAQLGGSVSIVGWFKLFFLMMLLLVVYLPWVVVGLFHAPLEEFRIAALCSIFVTPLILPNEGALQIGPRYYLVLVPFALATWGMSNIRIGKVFTILLVSVSILTWSINGVKLYENYTGRIYPAIKIIREIQPQVLLSPSMYPFQELQGEGISALQFLVKSASDMEAVLASCRINGINSFLWIERDGQAISDELELLLELHSCKKLGIYGDYAIRRCAAI